MKTLSRAIAHFGLCALAAFVWHSEASAQNVPATSQVVAVCGTPNSTYVAGRNMPETVDTNGNKCVSASGGAGTTANQGTPNAGGATNSWPVQGAGVAGTPAGGVVSVQGVASGTVVPANTAQVNGVTTSTGAGAVGTGSQRVTVGQDSTTVAGSATLPAGSAIIGKVGIDQTTPGTTNAVSATNFPSAVSTGTGAQGASSPRVTVATDTATLAGSAPGTAGTASSNVVTVQGVASMTKLLVTPDSVALPANQSVNESQINGVTPLMGAGATGTGAQRVTTSQDTTTIAGSAPGTAGSASANVLTVQGVASMTKLLVTPDSVALPANQSVNTSQVNGVTVLTGTGAQGTGSQRVTVATDSATVAGSASLPSGTNLIGKAGIDQTTVGTTNGVSLAQVGATTISTGTGAQGAGTPRVTVATDTATVAGSASIPSGTNLMGKVGIDQTTIGSTNGVTLVPGTSNGWTMATVTAANSTNATNLKSTAGTLGHVAAFTNSATQAWVSFYNTSGTPTCGSSIVWQVAIPGNASGAGAVEDIPAGLNFSTGIGYCITTGIAGTGSVAASAYVVDFAYK